MDKLLINNMDNLVEKIMGNSISDITDILRDPSVRVLGDGRMIRYDNNGSLHPTNMQNERKIKENVDSGKTDELPSVSNATYIIGGHKYETDHTGRIFRRDGKLIKEE